MSYSPDGKFFLTAGSDGTIKVWDAVSLKSHCHILNPHGESASSIYSATFSPAGDSYQILSTGRDKSAKLWNWDGKAAEPVLARKLPHDSNVRTAAYSTA